MPDASPLNALHVYRLGRVEYEDGIRLQELFVKARAQGLVEDSLLLLEHPPVLTLGRGAKRENLLATKSELERMGVSVFETDRGGDVTYHGPGQVVGYPIIQLPPDRQDVRRYVRDVEEVLITTLHRFGLDATRIGKWPGVWMGSLEEGTARKIGAIGVHIARWITSHGFALNVRPDLAHFGLIVPCGIRDVGVTTMELELGRAMKMDTVLRRLSESFGQVFEAQVHVETLAPERTVCVSVMRRTAGGAQVLLLKRTEERGGFWQIVTGRVEVGEEPAAAARRELAEETGSEQSVESLDYCHAFALGEEVPPRIAEESGFWTLWDDRRQVSLGPEHASLQWVSIPDALALLPFAGLREAVNRAAARLKSHS